LFFRGPIFKTLAPSGKRWHKLIKVFPEIKILGFVEPEKELEKLNHTFYYFQQIIQFNFWVSSKYLIKIRAI
jgi:hypothetical protein